MSALVIDRVTKRFGQQPVLTDFSLSLQAGEFVALLGPSGCGKSTVLSLIAGFEQANAGSIYLNDRLLNSLPPQARQVALVLQEFSVFSRLSVRQNLAFGLEARGLRRSAVVRQVEAAVDRFGLRDLLAKRTEDLNFSEKQKIALVRSLLTEPSVLLLDEPFSSLDATDRIQLRSELKRIQAELQATVLLVTHDQAEALSLADRVAVMRAGRIEQVGSPETLFQQPATPFVAEFLGEPPANLFPATVVATGERTQLQSGRISFRTDGAKPAGEQLTVGIRPHDLTLARDSSGIAVQIEDVEFLGAEELVRFTLGDLRLTALTLPGRFRRGERAFTSAGPIPALLLAVDQPVQLTRLEIVS